MTDSSSDSLHNQNDIDELEKVLYSEFLKQNSTEVKLKEIQLQLQEMTMAKLELERILESERRELSNMRAQLKMKEQWQQENSSNSSSGVIVDQKIQLESLTRERDALSKSVRELQLENMNLKMEIEDQGKQLDKVKKFKTLMDTNMATMNLTFEKIFKQNRALVAEQNSLKKMVESSKNTGQCLLQLLKQHHKVLNDTLAENKDLKLAQNLLTSELNLMKQKNQKSQEKSDKLENESKLESQVQKFMEMVTSLTNQINVEQEEKKNLGELLKKTLNEQLKYIETEQNLRSRIRDLERTIALQGNEMNLESIGSPENTRADL